MAEIITEPFDGAADTTVHSLAIWEPTGTGNADAFQLDGSGACKVVIPSQDAGGCLINSGNSNSHWAEVVIGAGFVAGTDRLGISFLGDGSRNEFGLVNYDGALLRTRANNWANRESVSQALSAGNTLLIEVVSNVVTIKLDTGSGYGSALITDDYGGSAGGYIGLMQDRSTTGTLADWIRSIRIGDGAYSAPGGGGGSALLAILLAHGEDA